jgi:hypothetical protein
MRLKTMKSFILKAVMDSKIDHQEKNDSLYNKAGSSSNDRSFHGIGSFSSAETYYTSSQSSGILNVNGDMNGIQGM